MVNGYQSLETSYFQGIKHITIPISEVLNTKWNRFDANYFCTEGRIARIKINKSKYDLISLNPSDKFVNRCFYPNRFKRIYVDEEFGLEFFLPSQINEIYPKPEKYISPKTEVDINELKVEKNCLLLTRSGTIGNLTYVSETLAGKIFSDDVIRIFLQNPDDVGYIYAFLKSKIGQDILITNNYGAVVQHIEPSHLSEIKIPNPPQNLRKQIHNLISKSFKQRDEANGLIYEAESKLINELNLPPLNQLTPESFGNNNDINSYIIHASNLQNRFDGSFHTPIVAAIEKHLKKYAAKVALLGDENITKNIFLPGRFKRIYVEEGQGRKFIGSKQIGELNPVNTKYLSIFKHKDELGQLNLKENMILVTRSGTIGNVKIVPKHWEKWVINEHVIRITPSSYRIAGYIYAWLDTPYGKELIKRFTFGSVVDEIDVNNIASVQIPLLQKGQIQDEINTLILKSNQLLYSAYLCENEAIARITSEVLV